MIIENDTIKIDPEIILGSEGRNILNKYISDIPAHIKGSERVGYLIGHALSMNPKDRFHLTEIINNLLKVTINKEASDIELGGFGSLGYVWLRIFGKKEPILELPRFSNDEAALLILSILNEKQIHLLEEIRNLDFSYSFEYLNYFYSDKT